jgi:hypothetical protein
MLAELRPEHELLKCISRPSLDGERAARVRLLLNDDLDWDYLLSTARNHSLIPFLHLHSSAIAPEAVPKQVLDQLRIEVDENTRRSLFLTGELVKLLTLFEEHGINAIPFKGPALALTTHGDVGLRQFIDLDLLIHKQDIRRVKQLLFDRGFASSLKLTEETEAALLRFDSAYTFDNQKGVVLDVHWNFVPRYFSIELDTQQLWNRREPLIIGRKALMTLAVEDQLLILCLHGFSHFWERLGWISDVANLIEGRNVDWDLTLRNASAQGCRRILYLGLLLASEVLGARIPDQVCQALPADRQVQDIAAQIQQQLFAERNSSQTFMSETRLHLKMRERRRDQISSGLRLIVTPRSYDWMYRPVPDSLFFLYYLVRPMRLIGKYGTKLIKRPRPVKSELIEANEDLSHM